MQLVILSGGKATRLYPLTQKIPKSMIEIYNKPFLLHQIELIKKNKINEILLCLGIHSEQIIEYFGDGEKFGISIKYSIESSEKLLGTAGSLKKAENLLEDEFAVMYGDSYLPINFQKIINKFHKIDKTAMMTVFKNKNNQYQNNVSIKNEIIQIYDKTSKQNLDYIDYGFLMFKKKILDFIPTNKFVNLEDCLKELVIKKEVSAYEVKETFYEIGSFEGIENFKKYVINT